MQITACIPAHNEEATIGQTIDSLLCDKDLPVLVGANACTDGTAEAARSHGARVIDIPRRGKTHAWNALLGEVRTPYALFADADVVIAKGSIDALAAHLLESGRTAVTGRVVFTSERPRWSDSLLFLETDRPVAIMGPLYALEVERTRTAIARYGAMPPVIAEDLWLSRVVDWELEEQAIAYHRPYTLREYIAVIRRAHSAERQMREEFPELSSGSLIFDQRPIGEKLRHKKEFLASMPLPSMLHHLAAYAVRKAAIRYAHRTCETAKSDSWGIAHSTKRPLPTPHL